MYRPSARRILLLALAPLALGTSIATSVAAQARLTGAAKWADSARTAIEAASMVGDADAVASARTVLDRALTAYPNDPLLLHYMGYAYYREATLRGRDRARSDVLFAKARDNLERSIARRPIPESHAILANVIGRQLARTPARGEELGPVIGRELDQAAAAGPENPRVHLILGINTLNTPEQYGGGLKPAEKQLERAVALFANDRPTAPNPNWGRAEAHTWLGIAYSRQNKMDAALREVRRALEIEPNYAFARRTILPAVEKKAAQLADAARKGL